ncbi:MAG: nucleotidyltransferase family protein [Fidelibacterota bacterium]|nr:MAG: nucleotidyltransferase family protein [Candidatus Neomarinimicrobiota bacterium]
MKALIPLAGQGTRLLPHTAKRQKALLPIAGKPVLDHLLEPLVSAGIAEVSLVTGHLGEQVREHMSKYSDLEVTYAEQREQRGLGEAVFLALEDKQEPAVVVVADTIFHLDYAGFINGEGNLIGVVEVDDPRRFGVVETTGRRIVQMVEKPDEPPSNLAIAGIYRIESQRDLRQILASNMDHKVTTRGEYQLTDALNHMVGQGERFHTYPVDRWLDCGTVETLLSTNRYLLEDLGGRFIDQEATVERSTIHSSSIMENCRVADSTLENCIILPDARVEQCHIYNEIVEEGAQLEGYSSKQMPPD